jgi:hypothetical protein
MQTSGVDPDSTTTNRAPVARRPLSGVVHRRTALAGVLVAVALAALTACWPPVGGPGTPPPPPQGKPGIATSVVWGDCPSGAHHCPLLTITSTGTSALRITEVDAPAASLFEGILTNGCIGTFAPGQSCEVQFGQTITTVTVTIHDNVPPGIQAVTLSV